ncbi:membrane protein [Streptococcus dysgalactiae subsp. equisimilis]|uniref:Membrane protein n=1 Tax=Streptococcus dysgalactiae subsp. equisimilis TaxID=119602 RepID=A0A9X8T2B7_STREQ|nr:hypothetical protein [Streptococcus dysgalactiae]SUN62369.1 membrane protein [Streptococcus dysgalactiae subsp. equisimilis]
MTDKEKAKLEALRQENAIKNMYYTRYFLIRYVVTFFFFINLYWLLMLYLSSTFTTMVFPITLIGFSIYAMWEQARMYSKTQKKAKATSLLFKVQILANGVLSALFLIGKGNHLFPFFSETLNTQLFLIAILLLGSILAIWMLSKLHRIDKKTDKQYRRIENYLATVKS